MRHPAPVEAGGGGGWQWEGGGGKHRPARRPSPPRLRPAERSVPRPAPHHPERRGLSVRGGAGRGKRFSPLSARGGAGRARAAPPGRRAAGRHALRPAPPGVTRGRGRGGGAARTREEAGAGRGARRPTASLNYVTSAADRTVLPCPPCSGSSCPETPLRSRRSSLGARGRAAFVLPPLNPPRPQPGSWQGQAGGARFGTAARAGVLLEFLPNSPYVVQHLKTQPRGADCQ